MTKKLSLKKLLLIVAPSMVVATGLLIVVLTFPMLVGVNDAGKRTVIQFPNGTVKIKFDPGWYGQFYGKVTEYNDFMTFDFSKEDAKGKATIDTDGIQVRYRDAGTGTIHGKARYALPNSTEEMLELHKAFKSFEGLASKLVRPVTEEAMNLTAGLMTSEGAYAEERGTFIKYSSSQVRNGKYATELKGITTKDEVTGQTVVKHVPVISYDDKTGQPIHLASDLKAYGITLAGLQVTDWNFEKRTLQQIAKKREATMAIITAKAEAEKAKQDAITAEEKGKAAVMTARYEKQVEKERAVVDAERQKEVAEIKASQQVEVAKQARLEAEQLKFKEAEIKEANILRGEGESEYKRLVMEADGALAQKLETYERVMIAGFKHFSNQKWVPEVVMGGDSGVNQNSATALIDMLSVKTATDLALDMKVPSVKK